MADTRTFFYFELIFMQMPPASRKLKHRNRFVFQVLRHMDCQSFSFICRKSRPFHVSFAPTCALTEFLYGYYLIMHSFQVDDIATILKISIYSFISQVFMRLSTQLDAGNLLLSITEMVLAFTEHTG